MKNIFLIGLLLIVTMSCEKESMEIPPINGTWIEMNHKSDTLVFEKKIFEFYSESWNGNKRWSFIAQIFVRDLFI